MKHVSSLLLPAVLLLSACTGIRSADGVKTAPAPGYEWLASSGEQTARERLTVFASDAMQGREAGTEGERMASEYLVQRLTAAGVLPGGDSTSGGRSYLQTFRTRARQLDVANLRMTGVGSDLGTSTLGTDWLTLPYWVESTFSDTLDVVFAGRGRAADYERIDAAGKLAVVVAAAPESINVALSTALLRGVAAVLVAYVPGFSAEYDNLMTLACQRVLLPPRAAGPSRNMPVLIASESFGTRVLRAVGAPSNIEEDIRRRRPISSAAIPLRVALHLPVRNEEVEMRNVVGYLPGARLPGEYVAIGAHYDHEGIKDGQVYNGADDDGSGTITVLNVAEAFARDRKAGRPTGRSLLFVFHTAEEKGLLGSEYFTGHPGQSIVKDLGRVVAQINMDMVGREARDSIFVVGAHKLSSRFGALVDSVNQHLGQNGTPLFHFDRKFDAPDDPERIYYRSDHYSYAKYGIPIVFFYDAMGANWRKGSPTDDYHKPTDDVEKIDFVKMNRAARLTYGITRATADAPSRPPVDQPEEVEGGR